MGKQLDIYKRFKANNPDKYYLFKGGIFYYFLSEDAEYFNNKCGFKLTAFGDSVKCGFPVSALEKYLYLFKEENIELISDDSGTEKIVVDIIRGIDLSNTTPEDAVNILAEIKEMLDEKQL